MANHPKWLNKYLQMKPEVNQILNDLDQLRQFCVDYGHPFDERNLYDNHSVTYQDFMRCKEGKHVKNRWFARADDDRNKFKPRERGYGNYRSGGGYNRNA
jgi:hypothetical protein